MPVSTLAAEEWTDHLGDQAASVVVLGGKRAPGFEPSVALVGDCQQRNLAANPTASKTTSDAGTDCGKPIRCASRVRRRASACINRNNPQDGSGCFLGGEPFGKKTRPQGSLSKP